MKTSAETAAESNTRSTKKGSASMKKRLANIRAMDASNASGMGRWTRGYLIVTVHLLSTLPALLLTLIVAPVYFPIVLLSRPVVRYKNWWVRCMELTAYASQVILTGLRLKTEPGLDVPKSGHIILVNHVNEFEFMPDRRVINKPFLANQALKVSPMIYAALRLGAGITFDEFDGRDMAASLGHMQEILKETSVIVYPEGRRTFSEEIQDLKTGVLKMAFKQGIPVTPVMKTGMATLRPFATTLHYFSPGTVRPEDHADFRGFFDEVKRLMRESKQEHNRKILGTATCSPE